MYAPVLFPKKRLPFARLSLMALMVATLTFSCEKPNDEPSPEPGQQVPDSTKPAKMGLVCPVGTLLADEEQVSQTIGPEGGEIQSADGRLTVTFPSGALRSAQNIRIQLITGTSPSGIGVGYRLLPDGATFAKPVSLTFTYGEGDLDGTVPEALTVAFQDKKGVWVAVGGTKTNVATHTVTAQTTHFTDWTMGKLFWVTPTQTVMDPGSTMEFKLLGYSDAVIEASKKGDAPLPEPAEFDQPLHWELGGAGQLREQGSRVTYTAPGQIPERNPVAISARFRQDGHEFLAVSNVYIAREGLTMRINGGPWMYSRPSALGAMSVKGIVLAQFSPLLNDQYRGVVSLAWFDRPSATGADLAYTKKLEHFLYTTENPTIQYYTFTAQGAHLVYSRGRLHVVDTGKAGDYVVGNFYLDRAGVLDATAGSYGRDPWIGTARVEGFFKVKRK